jgi:hypothetical protein
LDHRWLEFLFSVLLAVPRSEGAIEMGEIWNQHIKRKIEKKKKKKKKEEEMKRITLIEN